MIMDCGKISAGFVAGACGKLPIGGTGTRVVIMNHADIDTVTYSQDGGHITGITLKNKAHLYESIENSSEGTATFNKGTYTSGYTHGVTLRIFKDSAAARAWINQMTDARIAALLEKRENGDAKWEAYGLESGMKLNENSYSTTYADHVVAAPAFSSDDDSIESKMPMSFYTGTTDGTEEAVLALCQE